MSGAALYENNKDLVPSEIPYIFCSISSVPTGKLEVL